MRTFAILFAVLAAVCSASTDISGRKLSESNIHDREYYEKKFFDWMHEFEHEFEKASEYIHRLNIFATNDDYITKHNALPDLERGGIMLAHNEFSHYSSEEFKSHFTGAKVSEEYLKRRMNANVTALRSSMTNVPDEIDWVEKGAVTHVKNQGQCGSCWAFSTTGSIEGAAFIHNKKLPDLSEQELVDCDHNGDMGCGGGLMDHAFEWIEKHGGICSEEEYAYHASAGECKKCKPAVKVTKFTDVPTSDEEELKKAVAKQPVSVAIEADQLSFQFYHSGVYKKRCGTNLDHGVLVVGYGEEDGEKFWKVKNSWGESWGENGYIKLARDIGVPEGQCGIAMVPSYPEAEVVTEDEQADEKIEPEFSNLKSRSYYEEKFVEWMNKFEMKFERASEFVHRLNIFAENDDFITQHNSKPKDQRGGITLGHNEFSHYTSEEFKSYYTGLKVPENYINEKRNANATALRSSLTDVPDQIDWVEKGAVTHVKNQGQCGSCWAFSTTGSVEGAAFIHNKKLPELSEQELVDCDHNGDMGCGGGLMDHAFEWIEEHGGICSEEEYAYHASAGECKKCKPVVKITKFADVPSSDEEELKKAVAKQPVSVAIEADQRSFQFYQSGVFSDSCGTNLDHGVLVVGYGEEDGEKFWKVKNSWGPSWGDKGYIKLARNIGRPEGQCGIAMVPSYPQATVIDEETPEKETVEESIEEPVVSAYGSSASIEQCGDPKTAAVSFSALDISPKSPARGEPITFKGKGTIQKAFTSAVFEMKVELGGMKVYSHKGSMCGTTKIPLPLSLGEIEIHGFNCPAKQGSLDDVNLDVNLPDIAPAGNYQVSLVSKDGDDNVFCLNMKMKLSGDGMKKQTVVYQAIE